VLDTVLFNIKIQFIGIWLAFQERTVKNEIMQLQIVINKTETIKNILYYF